MARKKRLTKRQLKEDQFVISTFQAANYFQRHKGPVLLSAAGAIAVILIVGLFVRFQISSRRSAAAQLSQGVGLFQAGSYPEAAFQLKNFLDSHPKHAEAGYAALLRADALYYVGSLEEAAQLYRRSLETAADGGPIWSSARVGLAAIDEASGRPLAAAAVYEELATRQEDPTEKAHLIFSALRCYRAGLDYGEASRLLGELDEGRLDPIDVASLEWQKAEIEMGVRGGGLQER